MSADLRKQQEDLLRRLEKHGYTVEKGGGGHVKVRGDGLPMITTSATPSDHRTIKNFTAELRRKGYDVTLPEKKKVNPIGTLKVPPAKLRRDLKDLLVAMGEDPNRDPHKKGAAGGARAAVSDRMRAVYARKGLTPPSNTSALTATIRQVLAGDKIGDVKITVMEETVAELMNSYGMATPVSDGKKSRFRCNLCHQSFKDLPELSDHQRLFHGGVKPAAPPKLVEVPAPPAERGLAEELHLQVLAAILDPSVTRDEAFDLAERVRKLL